VETPCKYKLSEAFSALVLTNDMTQLSIKTWCTYCAGQAYPQAVSVAKLNSCENYSMLFSLRGRDKKKNFAVSRFLHMHT